jgi:uncharacterized protein YqcC (DUF446 family)
MDNQKEEYRTFGTITHRGDLHGEIAACLAYCESDRFPIPHFAPYFVECLGAIHAWCADGREPRYSERGTMRMGWVISQEFDQAGVPRVGEWRDMSARIRAVGNYFQYWPTDEQIAQRVQFMLPQVMKNRRAPSAAEVRAGVARIEAALRASGHWAALPIAPAKLESNQLTAPERLQFVILPEIQRLVASGDPLPEQMDLCYFANSLAPERALWPVMYAISELDELFFTLAYGGDNVWHQEH